MSTYQMQQYAFFGGVAIVAALLVWAIFIRTGDGFNGPWRKFAATHRLTFIPPISIGKLTVGHEKSVLHGVLDGVQVAFVSYRLANSPRAGINGNSEISGRALWPANVAFSMGIERGRQAPAPNLVMTGDPAFDPFFAVKSDNPGAARALLDPMLRAALFAAPYNEWSNLSIHYQGGEITVRWPNFAHEITHLDTGLRIVLAACRARLG